MVRALPTGLLGRALSPTEIGSKCAERFFLEIALFIFRLLSIFFVILLGKINIKIHDKAYCGSPKT